MKDDLMDFTDEEKQYVVNAVNLYGNTEGIKAWSMGLSIVVKIQTNGQQATQPQPEPTPEPEEKDDPPDKAE